MPLLSDAARHLVYPTTICESLFPVIEERLGEVGVEFDDWQRGFGTITLGLDDSGQYASTIGGVVASIPRQVGKTFTVGNILIGLCLEFPGFCGIWTSHHGTTTKNTLQSMEGMVRKPALWPHIQNVYTNNNDMRILFKNGSVIMFGAREHGFGRGLDAVDALVFDEAQKLGIKALEDMVPATNQSRNPHGALVFFIGTPPRPIDDGEAFTAKRRQALEGNADDDMVYVEFSADPDAELDDRSQWPVMNPSYPSRTPLKSMLRMRKNMPDDDSWRREAMGIWDEMDSVVFSYDRWLELADRDAPQPDRAALVVSVSQDRRWACISAAGDAGGKTLVMCFSMRGLSGVPARIVELQEQRCIEKVALAGAAAKALIPELTKAGVEFDVMTSSQLGASCTSFQEAVKDGTVVHLDQGEFNLSVENAVTRFSGESEVWDRRDPKVDDSPLVSGSAAFYLWSLQEAPMPAIY